MILALLIAASPPSSAYVQLKNQGVVLGSMRTLNCSGAGVTCTLDAGSGDGTLTVNVIVSDAGSSGPAYDGGPFIPACSVGNVLTGDGGRLYCTGFSYSQLSGSPIAGGSSPQVQYNNGGNLGGLANVTSDGTHEIYAPELTNPSAPTASSVAYDFGVNPGDGGPGLQIPTRIDAFMGVPIPTGALSGSPFTQDGTASNWMANCSFPSSWVATSFDNAFGGGAIAGTTTEGSALSGGGWDAGAGPFFPRMRRVNFSTTTTANRWAGTRRTAGDCWRGNTSGAGGFIFRTRVGFPQHEILDRTFVGLAASTSAFTNATEPSAQTDTVYVGCDHGDSNLQICSNDASGSATCNSLGANFPCKTNFAAYDVWLYAAPNAALINYFVQRLDSAQSIRGTVSSDLPANVYQLTPHIVVQNADAGVLSSIDIAYLCTWANW